ncbi:MAG: TonB family protein, partial [Acidobacteria bacterium]|nr:TonB family protein [Acidobacteriota bacterium]
ICGPPRLNLSLELAHQTLQEIGYLHSQRFVHRDLSPDNVMLTRAHDDTPLIKIIDLGIVKNLDSDGQMTVAGMFLGKARYSSPEQFSAGGDESVSVDYRSDAYSFGVVLYELLTGRCPVQGETFNELAAGHLFRPPLEFEESDPEQRVPPEIRQLVLKTLEKNPAARPSIDELTRLLDQFRDPAQVSGDEFREIFVRAFSGVSAPGTPPAQGTTQGRMDREFDIDRTTASGTTTDEAELDAGQPPLPAATAAGDAQGEPISAQLPREATPAPRSPTPAQSQLTPTEPPAEEEASIVVEEEVAAAVVADEEVTAAVVAEEEVAPAATAAPPRVAEASADRGGIRLHWVILGLVALFFVGVAGGYLWLHQPPPPTQNTIRVERAPVFSGPPVKRTSDAEEPGAEESATPDVEPRSLGPGPTVPSERAPVAPLKTAPSPQNATPEAASAREPSRSDSSPGEAEPATPTLTAEAAETDLPASTPPTVTSSSGILETDDVVEESTPDPEVTSLRADDPAPESNVLIVPPPQVPATVEPELPLGDQVLAPGPGVTPPRALRRRSPRYPPAARRLARGATIVVAVLVDETGEVSRARIVRGDSSSLGFNEAAMEAARGTTFAPATKDDEPAKMWAQLRFVFKP